jgi:hypothetical protein
MTEVENHRQLQEFLNCVPVDLAVWLNIDGREYRLRLPPFPNGRDCDVTQFVLPTTASVGDKPVTLAVELRGKSALWHPQGSMESSRSMLLVIFSGDWTPPKRHVTLFCRETEKQYLFTMTTRGSGNTPEEAWANAIDTIRFQLDEYLNPNDVPDWVVDWDEWYE